MFNLRSIPIFVTFIIIYCSLPTTPFSTANANADNTDLAIEVCKNTTDYKFCYDTIYSDPHAHGRDRGWLALIVFKKTYDNASDVKSHIDSDIKSIDAGHGDRDLLYGLRKCHGDYGLVMQSLEGMLGDLNSDSYSEFDIRCQEIDAQVKDCEKGFKGRSPITQKNNVMIKLANICYVVSLLFPYN